MSRHRLYTDEALRRVLLPPATVSVCREEVDPNVFDGGTGLRIPTPGQQRITINGQDADRLLEEMRLVLDELIELRAKHAEILKKLRGITQ